MLAILRDQGLEKYVEKGAEAPKAAIISPLTKEEVDTVEKWQEGDAKATTQIELSVGDSEMIHLSGTIMAHDMWNQLCTVKESRG